ncbi:hypothetical protein Aduo_005252 [Ancylostoma duodenale]
MMRKMLGVTLLHRRTNAWLHNMAKLPDVACRAIKRKWIDAFVSYRGETWIRVAVNDRMKWKRSMQRHTGTI